jgi:flagellum-specific ATP synthase/type III secretion protein N (ATPase)
VIFDLAQTREHIERACRPNYRGRVDQVSGVMVEAVGVPAALGEVCRIQRGALGPIEAEVVGFRGSTTLLMPHGDLQGIAPMQEVIALGRSFEIEVGEHLLGRVLNGFGRPIDRMEALDLDETPVSQHGIEEGASRSARISRRRSVRREAPDPLQRTPIREALQTGVRAVDGLNTLGRGQRVGIFAGSGVGKSTLMGQITRGTDADAIVCCLVGERGREVKEFLEEVLGPEGRERSVVVVATSDRSPIERYMAPFVAVTVAEHLRDSGSEVLLLMDSITRFATAVREIGLAAGEPPTVRGYPPSFFAITPRLIERMGRTHRGSITGLITILLSGDDPNEPVADTLRGLLDGHLHLSRDLAQAGHWPAIDLNASLSRLMPQLVDSTQLEHAAAVRDALAAWKEGRDLIEIGAYKAGSSPRLDRALALMPAIEHFLRQGVNELSPAAETRELLALVAGGGA